MTKSGNSLSLTRVNVRQRMKANSADEIAAAVVRAPSSLAKLVCAPLAGGAKFQVHLDHRITHRRTTHAGRSAGSDLSRSRDWR